MSQVQEQEQEQPQQQGKWPSVDHSCLPWDCHGKKIPHVMLMPNSAKVHNMTCYCGTLVTKQAKIHLCSTQLGQNQAWLAKYQLMTAYIS